jgi:hypothetical protein
MNRTKYLYELKRLGLTQQQAGVALDVSSRTGQRWAAKGPPAIVAAILIMVDGDRHKLEVLMKQARRS